MSDDPTRADGTDATPPLTTRGGDGKTRAVVNVFDPGHLTDAVGQYELILVDTPPAPAHLERRWVQLDDFDAKTYEAIDALTAVVEHPEASNYAPKRAALLEALNWLELDATCGDCVEGRCHFGGARSQASIEAANAGEEYDDPTFGRCGCDRHAVSVEARQRRARLRAAGILS
ncbi:hypothetical protein [Polymorphospora sp. NPDC050346]|uniref:hypothetical protein n=1 Tax=Polymorphospora sp. NPDC050346 TaxID=3155780 RepID=UPI0033DB9C2C